MTETVRILDRDDANVIIFTAMVDAFPDGDLLEVFGIKAGGDHTVAEVKMTVNGIEVPVVATLAYFWKKYDDHLNKAAQEKAKEMILGAGLQDTLNALQNAEWQIDTALDAFLKSKEAQ